MQIQKGSISLNKYKSVPHCFLSIYTSHGLPGLFKGTNITLLRETLPGGIYLTTYHLICQYFGVKNCEKK
jgi:hypothetical protein